jgi:hypothetical protein
MSIHPEPDLQELADGRRRFLAELDPLRARLERESAEVSRLYSVVRVDFVDSRIAHVRDYLHVPSYLLDSVARALGRAAPAGFEWAHLDVAEGG